MMLNADFNARAVVHAAKQRWVSSPTPGVERRMLFRIGDEKARCAMLMARCSTTAMNSCGLRHGRRTKISN